MENLHQIKIFIKKAEKFKLCEKYKEMTPETRDFFNEELGRFKLLVELNNSSQADEK